MKVRITNFTGCSRDFANIIEGSEHDVVPCPEKYKDKYSQSVWIMGLKEPVRLLEGEYEEVK